MKTEDSAFVKGLIIGIVGGYIFLMGMIALIDWLLGW